MMKNIVYILFLALTLNSCVKENLPGDAGSGREIEMKLLSMKTNGSDETINNVRIIVINKYGDVKFNESKPVVAGENEFTAVSRVGENDFYVICNETPEMSEALNGLAKGNELEEFKIRYHSEMNTSSLVMYGEMKNVKIESTEDEDPTAYIIKYTDADGTEHSGTKLPIAVKRLAVKVSLSFIKKTPDFTVSDISVKVIRLPKYSYLQEGKAYDGEMGTINIVKSATGELMNDNSAIFDTQSSDFNFDHEGDVVVFDDIYLPENIVASSHQGDSDYQTAILVSGKCTTTSGQVIIGNWQIGLMNLNNDLPRNSWYKIAATISGMGAIGLYAVIKEVTRHDISVNWKPQDGLVIVSDLETDYDQNVNIWNNYNVYFGVLKTYNATKRIYTDVLFKYGSVVAARGSEPKVDDGVAYTPAFDAEQDIMWQPRKLSNKITSWADIPYLNSGGNVPDNAGYMENGLGDPCKLVTLSAEQIERGIVDNGLWHMATDEEYEHLIKANDNKQGDIRGFNTYHLLLIPNTRVRDESGVLSDNTDGKGAYWSSKGGKAFEFIGGANTAEIKTYTNSDIGKGRTVRCVRNTIHESSMKLSGTTIPYSGGQGKVAISSNLTYWEAKLITADNVEDGETASDDNQINFLSPLTGSWYGTIDVELGLTKVTRRYYIRVTGIGLDGKIHKGVVGVNQNAGYINYNASFDPLLPKNISSGIYETTVIYDFIPNDPENVPMPSDKPYYLWVEVYKSSLYGERIFDSRTGTDGNLGMVIVPGTYQYKIKIQIPANDNIDPRSIFIKVNSDKFRSFEYGPIVQGSN